MDAPVRTRLHMCLSVRGALTNWGPSMYRGMFKHDDGREMTWREAKAALLDELSKGHEVLPYGNCDTFDYKTGCPGHVQPPDSVPSPPDGGGA